MKRILAWGLSAAIILPGVVLAGMAVTDHARTYIAYKRFASQTAEQRVKRLYQVGAERDWRLAGIVRETLEAGQNREELQAAGYAAMRINRPEFLPLLTARANEEPDDRARAMLIVYAARLSGRDARLGEWLTQGIQSDQPWRKVGSAAGLLHLGRIEAGPLLIAAVRGQDQEMAAFAWHELAWATDPMAQAIGKPMASLQADAPPGDAASIAHVESFWQEHVTVTLLNDVLRRLTLRDPDWTEMGRLIHARDKVAKLLQ